MVSVSGEELRSAILRILNEIAENPELKIEKLYKVAAIFLAVGEAKGRPSLRLLGNYLVAAPSKFKPLLAYKHQTAGTPLEEKISKPVEEMLNGFFEEVRNCADALAEEALDEGIIIRALGRIEDLWASMPTLEKVT